MLEPIINFYDIAPDVLAIVDKVKKKEIDLVCLAIKKQSLAKEIMMASKSIDLNRYYENCDLVNLKREAGCFRSILSITLMPLFDLENGLDAERTKFRLYLIDTILANQEYVKATKIVYLFEMGIWSSLCDEYRVLIETAVKEFYGQNPDFQSGEKTFFLKEIDVYSMI